MCGIVGAVARRNVVPILIEGLRKLEYRGYDSAGLALLNGAMERVRAVGRVADLEARATQVGADAPTGIAHTRWATHGGVTENNAHPHASISVGVEISVVHNGIIENHEALRARLIGLGYAVQVADRHRGDRAPGARLRDRRHDAVPGRAAGGA